ncbi:MAG: hypothetical protein Q7J47_06015 [Azoarcus sp.]|nr:hypothetical protein [Azoarcus sp.]
MSGGTTAVLAAAAVAGTAYSVYSGERASRAQDKAQKNAERSAQAQAKAAEQDFNRLNQKKPNLGAIIEGNAKEGAAGSTMLTGPAGVSSDKLTLGRSSLLGG